MLPREKKNCQNKLCGWGDGAGHRMFAMPASRPAFDPVESLSVKDRCYGVRL